VVTDAAMLAAIDTGRPGLSALRAAAAAGDLAAVKRAYLDFRRGAGQPAWRMPSPEFDASARAAPPPPAGPGARTDPDGELVCAHIIRNYYYNFPPASADMGRDFDWDFNPTPRSSPDFTDEWTWCVVGRTEFWAKLADAYVRTGNEKYAREWVAQLADFAAKNRCDQAGREGRASLWRTLEASKRIAKSWPYAYYRFLRSPEFTPEAQWLFLKLAYDHATCLVAGLGRPERSGNWVSSECLGLYTIGTLFPELREAPAWRGLALDRMMREVDRMVLPDGMEAELSPSYHVIAINGFRGVLELARMNRLPTPDALRARILDMYKALVLVMDQGGAVVPTNDSNPQVSAIEQARRGLELGDDPLLEWAASGGRSGRPPPDSTFLPYAGFYALRSGWDPGDLFLFFRAGPTGLSHEHEDMLEVAMSAQGRNLLFDAGLYSYDHSDWRRYTVGTASHNTVIVDGRWQHRGASAVPVAQPAPSPWIATPLFDCTAGTYDAGYQGSLHNPAKSPRPQDWIGTPDRSVSHTRWVILLRPAYALVLDSLQGAGLHTADALFHLASPAAAVDAATQAVFSRNPDGVQIGLYPLARGDLAADVVQGQREPLLGWLPQEHRPVPTARFRKVREMPATFATLLYPFRGREPAVGVEPLAGEQGPLWGARLRTPLETAEILLSPDGTARRLELRSDPFGEVAAEAAGLVLRAPLRGERARGGWRLAAYRDAEVAFSLDAPAAVVVAMRGGLPLIFNGERRPVEVALVRPFPQRASLAPGAWTEIAPGGPRATAGPDWRGLGR